MTVTVNYYLLSASYVPLTVAGWVHISFNNPSSSVGRYHYKLSFIGELGEYTGPTICLLCSCSLCTRLSYTHHINTFTFTLLRLCFVHPFLIFFYAVHYLSCLSYLSTLPISVQLQTGLWNLITIFIFLIKTSLLQVKNASNSFIFCFFTSYLLTLCSTDLGEKTHL